MRPRRLALFAPLPPFPPNFYLDLLFGMKRGFEALGVDTYVGTSLLPSPVLKVFSNQYRPDVVLEINRVRNKVPDLPKAVLHVAWMQDVRVNEQRSTEEPSESEITYFIVDPEVMGYPPGARGKKAILFPGTDTSVYFPDDKEPVSDFSFLGYIPGPLLPPMLNMVIFEHPIKGKLTMGDLVQDLGARAELRHENFDLRDIHACVKMGLERFLGEPLGMEVPDPILTLFDTVVIRILDRRALLEAVLRVSRSLRIYGPESWQHWPEFKPYHLGYLDDVREMRDVYGTTRVNLHNGRLGQHYRVLDCMASGGFLLVNQCRHERDAGGIRRTFEPGTHYVPYTLDTLSDVAREVLADEALRRRIGKQAFEAVSAHHTWKHRAQQILSDLAEL
jgi:hypothetical protein